MAERRATPGLWMMRPPGLVPRMADVRERAIEPGSGPLHAITGTEGHFNHPTVHISLMRLHIATQCIYIELWICTAGLGATVRCMD